MSGVDRDFAHLAALVESARDAVVGMNLEDRIVSWNRGAKEIYGYSASEAIGKSFGSLTRLSGVDLAALDDSECVLTKHYNRDAQPIDVILTVSPIADSRGKVIGRSAIVKRLSQPHLASKNKQEWISIVSHELRTPLTSITGSLGLLLTGKLGTLSPQGQRMVEIAANNTDRLLRLLNDLLELERLQATDWLIRKKSHNLAEIMQDAAETMQSLAQQKGIKILVTQTPIFIEADRDRLVQLLVNLLSNAIKFSPANSEICLSATSEADCDVSALGEKVVVKVSDRGRGIPLDKQELIFESFEQVDPSDAREKQGTGLGLAICRSIVCQHQGKIWVESQLGEGSTFFVELPLS